jgi:hypothetical protein
MGVYILFYSVVANRQVYSAVAKTQVYIVVVKTDTYAVFLRGKYAVWLQTKRMISYRQV